MKSLTELEHLLYLEITHHIEKVKLSERVDYNNLMGDTSILLTLILEKYLLKGEDWDRNKWLDDCLITDVKISNNFKVSIWGIVIFGKNDTTEQWTSPLYFEVDFPYDKNFKFLLGDKEQSDITYEEFQNNREFWLDENRNWKYKLNL